ncbi:hypothetical protein [Dactylosporangium sp. NPDC049140]|uniref:hypothetical protein n=1 Tax=Dactylosporangium sp. NPDC049140 TaxID=3155647 RepID=UPI0033DB65A4
MCAKLLLMLSDELRVERLHRDERLAVALITGVAENCTLRGGHSLAEGRDAIAAELEPHHPGRRRLILAHSAAAFVGGEYHYQQACAELLLGLGADLDLAVRIAIRRTGLPVTNLGNAERRRRLMAIEPLPAPDPGDATGDARGAG